MDVFTNWLSAHKVPVGEWGEAMFDFITGHFENTFDTISAVITGPIDMLVAGLLWLPSPIFIAAAMAAAYALKRSIPHAIGVGLGFVAIANQGFWVEMMQTLGLVLASTLATMTIGVPIGIFLGHRRHLFAIVAPLLDLMQTLPTFIYLIPTLVLFGLGTAPGMVAAVIFSLPAVIRLTYVAISSVPPLLRETGDAFGATSSQKLFKIELPSAMPVIMEALTQCIMLSLSMVVVAALVGANGLGKPVVQALSTINVPLGLEAGLSIVVLAVILDRTLKIARIQER